MGTFMKSNGALTGWPSTETAAPSPAVIGGAYYAPFYVSASVFAPTSKNCSFNEGLPTLIGSLTRYGKRIVTESTQSRSNGSVDAGGTGLG